MKKIFLFCFIAVTFIQGALAQGQNNNWFFGSNHYISFNSGSPVISADMQSPAFRPGTSISDDAGNLLFYTDGQKVFSRDHSQMPGGSGLQGAGTQSVVIIPDPGNSNHYYVFTSGSAVKYSIVDMTLNGGLGDVTVKNIVVDNSGELITATRHRDGVNYWLVSKSFSLFTDQFVSYPVTPSGIGPGISSITSVISSGASEGMFKISNDGCWLVTADNGNFDFARKDVGLYQFNNYSGAVSNGTYVNTVSFPATAAFSPDNSKFYIGQRIKYNFNFGDSGVDQPVLQYDLNAGTPAAILASATAVSVPLHSVYAMEAAPDSKIYFCRLQAGPPSTYANRLAESQQALGAIENPSASGNLSNVNLTEISSSLLSINRELPVFFNLPYAGALNFCSSVFAVKLISFKANIVGVDALLSWFTENDRNINSFDIEVSPDGNSFSKTGSVENSHAPGTLHSYQFTDPLFSSYKEKAYYRLREHHPDGGIDESAIISLEQPGTRSFNIYPNPFITGFSVKPISSDPADRVLESALYDPAGKLIINNKAGENGTAEFKELHYVPAGTYLLWIRTLKSSFYLKVVKA